MYIIAHVHNCNVVISQVDHVRLAYKRSNCCKCYSDGLSGHVSTIVLIFELISPAFVWLLHHVHCRTIDQIQILILQMNPPHLDTG